MAERPLPGIPPAPKKKVGGYRPGAGRPKQERCKRGHSLTDPANVYIGPKGYPFCRACKTLRQQEARNQLKRAREGAKTVMAGSAPNARPAI